MLQSITYGTYILFGLLTTLGAAFVWFFLPETKRLTLEEMDLVFGSPGTAQADFERMTEINEEIGLNRFLNTSVPSGNAGRGVTSTEKMDIKEKEDSS